MEKDKPTPGRQCAQPVFHALPSKITVNGRKIAWRTAGDNLTRAAPMASGPKEPNRFFQRFRDFCTAIIGSFALFSIH
jgi:hypothetical protein